MSDAFNNEAEVQSQESLTPKSSQPVPAFCKYCGSPIQHGSAFCSSCGKPLKSPPQRQQIASAIPPLQQNLVQQPAQQPAYSAGVYQQPSPQPVMSGSTQNSSTTVIVQGSKSNGLGTAGFILALLAFLVSWVPVVDIIVWALGLLFSFIGMFKAPRGLAIAGFILSIIGIIVLITFFGALIGLTSH